MKIVPLTALGSLKKRVLAGTRAHGPGPAGYSLLDDPSAESLPPDSTLASVRRSDDGSGCRGAMPVFQLGAAAHDSPLRRQEDC
jgi:hypothetical protein